MKDSESCACWNTCRSVSIYQHFNYYFELRSFWENILPEHQTGKNYISLSQVSLAILGAQLRALLKPLKTIEYCNDLSGFITLIWCRETPVSYTWDVHFFFQTPSCQLCRAGPWPARPSVSRPLPGLELVPLSVPARVHGLSLFIYT